MIKNGAIKALLYLTLSILSTSMLARHFRPDSTDDLITAILLANHNGEDDVIDLQGRSFNLDRVYPASVATNGNTCLPEIQPDTLLGQNHALTIMNGTIIRDLMSPISCRFFFIQANAPVNLKDLSLENGLLIGNNTIPTFYGAAIYSRGTLSIDRTTFLNNVTTGGDGGAIASIASTSKLAIANSTFYGNSAGFAGGAIINGALITKLFNCTFTDNQASFAGAILMANFNNPRINFFSNNTVAHNTTIINSGGIEFQAGIVDNFMSNIVAGNISGGTADLVNTANTIVNASYNLIGDGTDSNITNGTNHNQVGTNPNPIDPMLEPLGNNGGRVLTMALLPTSPALEAGANPLALHFDARGPGYLRTRGAVTDVGAYELQICNNIGDSDRDGVCSDVDNCVCTYNPDQRDCNHNGVGDACDPCHCRRPHDDDDGDCPAN